MFHKLNQPNGFMSACIYVDFVWGESDCRNIDQILSL